MLNSTAHPAVEPVICCDRNPWIYSCFIAGLLSFLVMPVFAGLELVEADFALTIPYLLFCGLFVLPLAIIAVTAFVFGNPLVCCDADKIALEDGLFFWRKVAIPKTDILTVQAADTLTGGTGDERRDELVFEVTPESYDQLRNSKLWSGRFPECHRLVFPFHNSAHSSVVMADLIRDWISVR